MMHLDAKKYAALLDGTLAPDEARALATHLDGECEQCERLLSGNGADAIDGLADALTATALPPAAGEGNDLEFARITRALHTRRPPARRFLLASAMAASILGVGVAGYLALELRARRAEVAGWDGAKGLTAPRAIPIRLRFVELGAGGRLEKGISGEPVDGASSLLFEVEASRAANLVLARVSPDGTSELIWHRRVAGGRTQVGLNGRPAAYPLAGLTGAQRFVLVASEMELDDLRVRQAVRALAPPSRISPDAPELDGLSLDVVEVPVR